MCEKSFVLCGPEDVAIRDEPFSTLVLKKLRTRPPGHVLMVDHGSKRSITARELLEKSVQLADALRQRGIKRGDVVSIVCENNINYFIPVLATLCNGSSISPVNPAYTIGELRHVFKTTRPRIVFSSQTTMAAVLQIQEEVDFIESVVIIGSQLDQTVDLDAFMSGGICDPNTCEVNGTYSGDEAAIILTSSGTTGLPKGVMISYDSLQHHLAYIEPEQYMGMTSDVVTFGIVPFFHIFGLFLHLFGIFSGMKSIVLDKFKPEVYLQAIEQYKVTKLFIVPPLAIFLAKSPLVQRFDLSSVKDIMCGGAPLSQQIEKHLQARFNVKVRQLYGLTETGAATINDYQRPEKSGTVGVLVPNLKAKVRDTETKRELGADESGELCFKGPTVMIGYINNSQATSDAFDEDGYFCTGDIGYYDKEGYFFIVDRLKDLIKYKGFQVPPAELEAILLQHPCVAEAAVIGIPDERVGELPLAVIVKKQNTDLTEQELIDLVSEHVSVQKRLHGGVKFVDRLPKTPTGKILKRTLREDILDCVKESL